MGLYQYKRYNFFYTLENPTIEWVVPIDQYKTEKKLHDKSEFWYGSGTVIHSPDTGWPVKHGRVFLVPCTMYLVT